MALLSGKTTDGRPAWNKYVLQNKNWKSLTLQIENKIKDVNFLVRKGTNYDPTLMFLSEGDTFSLESNRTFRYNSVELAHVKYNNQKGFLPINKIRKPSGFDSVKDETIALENLDEAIKKIGYPIDIQLEGDRKIYKGITGAKTIAGVPKADFACVNTSGAQIFISHKKSGGAKAFQQYSGVTEAAGREINLHPEVVNFMRLVSQNIKNDKLMHPMYTILEDKKLINRSIFGPDFGKRFGKENCQIIGQGQAVLNPTEKDGLFRLTFDDHIALNGDVDMFMKGDYIAVLAATYRAGRGFNVDGKRFIGARVGIYPIDFIKNRSGVLQV
jgi:hypothetical protein